MGNIPLFESMQKFFLAVVVFLATFSSTFAFDPSCFRESVSFSPPSGSSSFIVRSPSFDEDVFFVQSGSLLSSTLFTRAKNPPISLSVTGISLDERPLFDGDALTYDSIDPYEISFHDISLVFDL